MATVQTPGLQGKGDTFLLRDVNPEAGLAGVAEAGARRETQVFVATLVKLQLDRWASLQTDGRPFVRLQYAMSCANFLCKRQMCRLGKRYKHRSLNQLKLLALSVSGNA